MTVRPRRLVLPIANSLAYHNGIDTRFAPVKPKREFMERMSGEKRPAAGAERKSPPLTRGLAFWLLVFSGLMLLVWVHTRTQTPDKVIAYHPDFVGLVTSGQLSECELIDETTGQRYIRGEGPDGPFRVDVIITAELLQWLQDNGVAFRIRRPSHAVWQVVSALLPVILIIAVLYFVFIRQMRSVGHGVMTFGKSRARMLTQERQRITFKDVAGIDEAKEEMQEIIDFLKDPKRFQKLGGRIPKGVLLMGPPGTGKTLLAKAIAGEAEVPFFSISGSDFVEMFVGVGASRVRDMFETAKKNAPCLLFIDEIDAVGRSRFSGIGGGHDEREQTLNALLVEMDGFDTQEGVIIIAATNRPDVLDSALQRPGRFDRQIGIDLPMVDGRAEILKLHTAKIPLDAHVELHRLARGTPGFSGADLANLVNEAALLAARQGKETVEMADLEEARDKVRWGRERRTRVLDDKDKRITAYHESGHALVTQLTDDSEPLHKITIIPRGRAYLGATMQLPEKDRYIEGRRKLKGMLRTLMGGRVTEQLVFNDITTGAGNDLKEATRIARLMVCSWGMSDAIGPQTFGNNEEVLFLGREVSRSQDFSEATARRIDAETSRLLREAYDEARRLIETHRDTLDRIAELLIERETIDGNDIIDLVEHGRLRTEEERAASPSPATAPVPDKLAPISPMEAPSASGNKIPEP